MKWILITAGIAIVVIVIAFSMYVKNKKSYFSAENAVITYIPSQKMREAVETYHEIMMAAAYENFSSEKEADYTDDMEWFSGFVAERIELYGPLKSIDEPEYISTNEARIVVRFTENSYEFVLTVDPAGEIEKIDLTNYASESTLSNSTWEVQGDDTLRVATIESLSSLTKALEENKGSVLLVSILSPT